MNDQNWSQLCCRHRREQHWPEGRCAICIDCTADSYGPRPSTDELLGADPDYLGGQPVDEYIDEIRE